MDTQLSTPRHRTKIAVGIIAAIVAVATILCLAGVCSLNTIAASISVIALCLAL
jgi:hypothetical protein